MKVDRINYQKVFPLGMYINERIGVEIQLDKGDNPEEALLKAKEMVEAFHKENNKGLYMEGTPEIPIEKPKPEEIRIGLFAEDINSCKDMETLKGYRLLVKGKPELQQAYDNKLKELNNQKP